MDVHRIPNEKGATKAFDLGVVWLPRKKLDGLDQAYSAGDQDTVPVLLVCVYNVEQLATEIAKHLKESTNNG